MNVGFDRFDDDLMGIGEPGARGLSRDEDMPPS